MSSEMYKIGTTIPIKSEIILSFFAKHTVDERFNNLTEFQLKDGSKIQLKRSLDDDKYFVNIYLKFNIIQNLGQKTNSLSFPLQLILNFFTECNSQIKNLRTNVIMPISEGALLSDIFSTNQFRKAMQLASNPKDIQVQGRKNRHL